ncbi:hypothetical protein [Flavobacterium anhuiense]|uniref:hypothetical protein n=1 Tax=Flavobacterium anhuiense TaxID=459526 RepID=UPI0034D96BC7
MKSIALLFILSVSQINFGQNKIEATGNVGIGTTSPLNGLQVFKLNDFDGGSIRFGHSGSNDGIISFGWNARTLTDAFKISYSPHNLNSSIIDLLSIGTNGNVGIGTTLPNAKLEIFNTAKAGHLVLSANDNPNADMTRIDIDFNVANQYHTVGRISSFYLNSADGGSGGLRFFTRENGALNEKMNINHNGNVGIGKSNPTNKLDVNGAIHSKEVKEDMTGWSDFVFKKDYALPTLEEVEKHIAEKGHLENIPSEEEVLKNGINLGEMNAKLLQKIEELTLYNIQQQKQINALNDKLEKMKILLNETISSKNK